MIADAYALPWRGCDIELKQQSVNVGGCALNIAVALKRLGIEAGNALPLGQGVWAEIIRNRMAKEGLISLIDNAEGDNGWCLALVEPDGERTFMSFSGVENQWNRQWLARLTVAPGSLLYFSGYQLASPCVRIISGMAGKAARRDAVYRFWPTYWAISGCIAGADHGLSTFSVTQSSGG
ncbi:putative carbohydrate/pyrimidine kinase [Escherichia coli]|uniref:Putative carbohydrate/pyrimidine kinase n=1 Tax=Escherichia coli TaxID=562 RepID=A0A377D7P3_ECOLX|nr:putative carbohydrate/pyrimidine kinase [Escherichia coli]